MHDVMVALTFLAIIACPLIVAARPKKEDPEDNE